MHLRQQPALMENGPHGHALQRTAGDSRNRVFCDLEGSFSIATAGRPINANTLTNPNVDGISLKQAWFDLEKTENVYDFTYFDTEVAKAAVTGGRLCSVS